MEQANDSTRGLPYQDTVHQALKIMQKLANGLMNLDQFRFLFKNFLEIQFLRDYYNIYLLLDWSHKDTNTVKLIDLCLPIDSCSTTPLLSKQ